MKGFLKGIIFTIVVLVIVAVLVLGYLGLVPGVSSLFGSDKPRDLGVAYTEQDRLSARAKSAVQVTPLSSELPPAQSLKYTGQKAVSATYTEAEFNAFANDKWAYYPVTDCQVKIGKDGTTEVSGIILTDRINNCAAALNIPDETMKNVTPYLQYVKGNPPFYLKGSGSVVNNQITGLDIDQLEIGRLSVPQDQIESNRENLASFGNNLINRIPGFSVKSFKFVDGKAQFEGTLPETKSFSPAD